jgi:hypothetical protein
MAVALVGLHPIRERHQPDFLEMIGALNALQLQVNDC